jgi:hypothetical protein
VTYNPLPYPPPEIRVKLKMIELFVELCFEFLE